MFCVYVCNFKHFKSSTALFPCPYFMLFLFVQWLSYYIFSVRAAISHAKIVADFNKWTTEKLWFYSMLFVWILNQLNCIFFNGCVAFFAFCFLLGCCPVVWSVECACAYMRNAMMDNICFSMINKCNKQWKIVKLPRKHVLLYNMLLGCMLYAFFFICKHITIIKCNRLMNFVVNCDERFSWDVTVTLMAIFKCTQGTNKRVCATHQHRKLTCI